MPGQRGRRSGESGAEKVAQPLLVVVPSLHAAGFLLGDMGKGTVPSSKGSGRFMGDCVWKASADPAPVPLVLQTGKDELAQ